MGAWSRDRSGVEPLQRVLAEYRHTRASTDEAAWRRLHLALREAMVEVGERLRALQDPEHPTFTAQALRCQVSLATQLDQLGEAATLHQFALCSARADQLIRTMNACYAMMKIEASRLRSTFIDIPDVPIDIPNRRIQWPDNTPVIPPELDERTTSVRPLPT